MLTGMEPGVGKESEAAAAAQGLMAMTVRKGANTSNDSSTSGVTGGSASGFGKFQRVFGVRLS